MGMVNFYGNRAQVIGGAMLIYDIDMAVYGNAYFENNNAIDGGAMYLAGASHLILSPSAFNISFILNYANGMGGAIYHSDSQCSLGSNLECFLSIYSNNSNYATGNISLIFLNNSASFGSTLYGGQLDKCRLHYRTNYSLNKCGNRACNDYSYDALGIFMKISRITNSESVTNISSPAERIKFCDKNLILDLEWHMLDDDLHPGEQFTISVTALGQTGSPVPTTIFNRNEFASDKCYLAPSSRQIHSGSCTNITFKLLSVEGNYCYGFTKFKLYPENPCQSRTDGLTLLINIVACPIGFELLDDRCMCNDKLLQFTQKCKIGDSIGIIERMRNNFWILELNADTLIIHEYRCPLDYCKDVHVDVSFNDPSVQCDFNRNGTLCGQCAEKFNLALGSLHCITCDNKHIPLILLFIMAGIFLIVRIFLL